MKTYFFITVYLLFMAPGNLFAQEWIWGKSVGGTGADDSRAIATLEDGTSYITGRFFGTAQFGTISLTATAYDFFLAKVDPSGHIIWVRRSTGALDENGIDVDTDLYGNVYVTGSYEGTPQFENRILTNRGGKDIFIAKYTSDGSLVWMNKAGSIENDLPTDLDVTNDGECVITGRFSQTLRFFDITSPSENYIDLVSKGWDDGFVARFNEYGFCAWAKAMGGIYNDEGDVIHHDMWGNIYVAGKFWGTMTFGKVTISSTGSHDLFIAKVKPNGIFEWIKKATSNYANYLYGIDVDTARNIYFTGSFSGTLSYDTLQLISSGQMDIFCLKLDPSGTLRRGVKAGGSGNELAYDIVVDHQTYDWYVAGSFSESLQIGDSLLSGKGGLDIFISRFDSSANLVWAISKGSTADDEPTGISLDADKNIYVTGYQKAGIIFGNDTTTGFGNKDGIIAKWLAHTPVHYKFTGNGNWSVPSNWENNVVPPPVLLKRDTITIAALPEDSCLLDVAQIMENGSVLIITPQSHFIVQGNLQPPEPVVEDSTFTDPRDGQVYPIKRYGKQVWMTANLNYSPGSVVYNNDPANAEKFGRLYHWDYAMTACPAGWNLPSRAEWDTLRSFIATTAAMRDTLFWLNPNRDATNSSGFSARPGGFEAGGEFQEIGEWGVWWTSTLGSSQVGEYHWAIAFWMPATGNGNYFQDRKEYYESVRCIKTNK